MGHSTLRHPNGRPVLAFGPRVPENGSWEWIGEDLANELAGEYEIKSWETAPPTCDLLVIVKYPLPADFLEAIPAQLPILYFPIDYFQSEQHVAEIAPFLSRCQAILVSSSRLKIQLEPYAPTQLLDHHVKYVLPRMVQPDPAGPVLWTGVRTNLPPLVDWINSHGLPRPLLVLTNPEACRGELNAKEFGFHDSSCISIEVWSHQRHLRALSEASACLDIKGDDFSQRHKPSTKAIDALAAGLPFAINIDAAPAEHLRDLGFEVASPLDADRWFSQEYAEDCASMGTLLRESLSIHRIGARCSKVIRDVLAKAKDHADRDTELQTGSSQRRVHIASASRSTPAQSPAGELAASRIGSKNQVRRSRVAILSFLFNWPSTGGGIVHTMELAKFLSHDGFEVLHVYARNPAWNVGRVDEPLPYDARALDFSDSSRLGQILEAYRNELQRFQPDFVIITDSWNIKPWLAKAASDFPFLLRFQALECLCPLNNVRFLPKPDGAFSQCGKHQLATSDECCSCLSMRGHLSGSLHQWERSLCDVGSRAYDRALRDAVRDAHAVLVVNPDMATMFSPYSDRVHVVPSGFDAARFPLADPATRAFDNGRQKCRILFAGLVEEWIKGFPYLYDACRLLWQRRQDFELVVTSDPIGQQQDFIQCIGWQSQAGLARQLQFVDIVVVPTIAQEALGRTAVEAMAAARPVVASRIGGLRSTVLEGCTGLLAEPGDAADLALKIEQLIDDPDLRRRFGTAGRKRFEEHFSWDVIIPRHYRGLLSPLAARRQ